MRRLSVTQQKMVEIARALTTQAKVIVLDEPTNGLDPQGMKEVRELIHRLSTELGITVLLSSHLLNEVEQVATRMAIINKGTMVVQGSVDELLRAAVRTTLFSVTPQKKAVRILGELKGIEQVEVIEGDIRVKVPAKRIPALVSALVDAGCSVHAVTPEHSLERYFLSVTEQS